MENLTRDKTPKRNKVIGGDEVKEHKEITYMTLLKRS
jgi:hypothetical protein